mgnify:FL=1
MAYDVARVLTEIQRLRSIGLKWGRVAAALNDLRMYRADRTKWTAGRLVYFMTKHVDVSAPRVVTTTGPRTRFCRLRGCRREFVVPVATLKGGVSLVYCSEACAEAAKGRAARKAGQLWRTRVRA